jgi:hypothetical protein
VQHFNIASIIFHVTVNMTISLFLQNKVQFEFSRQDFEQGCDPLFQRGLAPVFRLLESLGEFSLLELVSILKSVFSIL